MWNQPRDSNDKPHLVKYEHAMNTPLSYRTPGYSLRNHRLEVPLDYRDPKGRKISIFAREVTSIDNENRDLPWIAFFQGGPGFASPRPGIHSNAILTRGLKEFRVLLIDQRGTGLSSRISHETLAALGSPKAQMKFLKNFRADSIVKDAEMLRKHLLGKNKKWSILGQSFGGFISTSYLSFAPEGLESVLITGGIPPAGFAIDEIYRVLHKRIIGKNKLFYERFPQDIERVYEIVEHLRKNKIYLPCGDRLSAERFLQIGLMFGMSYGFDTVHYLIEEAFDFIRNKPTIAYGFKRSIENFLNFDTNPIYALLHEPAYCEGAASKWSADRVRKEFDEFDSQNKPILFSGETIHRWMFDQYRTLKPLKGAADLLANYEDWEPLYDEKQLRQNSVPVAAAAYYDDMYVDLHLSESAAQKIRGIKVWVTNQFEHDGLRTGGEEVVDKLLSLVRGNTAYQAGLLK